MLEVQLIDDPEQANAVLHPTRLDLLRRLAEPHSCTELASQLVSTPQKVHYHVKVLERHGTVAKVAERKVRALTEAIYQATARSYWLSAGLVGRMGGPRRARDGLSLGFLLQSAEALQRDVSRLAVRAIAQPVDSLGSTAEIELRSGADKAAFLADVRSAIESLAHKYGARKEAGEEAGETFRLLLACYPNPDQPERDTATQLPESTEDES